MIEIQDREQLHATPSVAERVALLVANPSPDEQWAGLQRIDVAAVRYNEATDTWIRQEEDPGDVATALVDFALNPESSSSTLVRAYALEEGMTILRQGIEADATLRVRIRPDVGFLYMELEDGLRDLFDSRIKLELQGGHHRDLAPERRDQIDAYRTAAARLAQAEGLTLDGTIYPSWDTAMENGYFTPSWDVPLLPFLLAEYHAGNYSTQDRYDAPLVNYMSPQLLGDCLRSVLNRPNGTCDDNGVLAFSELTRYVREGGAEHGAPLDFLYKLEPSERTEYVKALNGLYEAGDSLPVFFPVVSPDKTALGFRSVAANGLFAVADHIENGKHTDEELRLLGGSIKPVQYEGDELLELLRGMELIRKAHEVMMHPDTVVGVAVDEASFVIYSFTNHVLKNHPRVMKHLRPEGGFDVNYRYEYGGRHTGVQACSDTRIDAEQPLNPARPYHKSSLSSQSISVRLDREGRSPERAVALNEQDPTSQTGTVCLDVGSIMGDGLGSRIGRLLAWGNVLRSRSAGMPPRLNHISETFDSEIGDATVFKEMILNEIRYWESRRTDDGPKPRVLRAAE